MYLKKKKLLEISDRYIETSSRDVNLPRKKHNPGLILTVTFLVRASGKNFKKRQCYIVYSFFGTVRNSFLKTYAKG